MHANMDNDDAENMLFGLPPAAAISPAAASIQNMLVPFQGQQGQGPGAIAAAGAAGGKASNAKAKAKSKAKGKTERPGVLAAKIRQTTMRVWTQVQSDTKEACRIGATMLVDCVAQYRPSYEVVQRRLACLERLIDSKRQKPTVKIGEELLECLNQDSYFNEQAWRPQAVQTLGQLTHVRTTLLELQRTADAVNELGNNHRDGLDVLKIVAKSILTEVSCWKSNLAALRKARDLEQKQLVKEAERLAKLQERQASKLAKQQKAALEKKRKAEKAEADRLAAVEAAKNGEEAEQEHTPGPKIKRRKASHELAESDPKILQTMCQGSWPDGYKMRYMQNLDEMATFIARTAGMVPVVVRHRRSALKKVVEAAGAGTAVGARECMFR